MSENPKYLIIQHLYRPKGARLKKIYCTYGMHMAQDDGKWEGEWIKSGLGPYNQCQ